MLKFEGGILPANGRQRVFLGRNPRGLNEKVGDEVAIPISDMKTVLNRFIREQRYRPIWSVVQYRNLEEITVVF